MILLPVASNLGYCTFAKTNEWMGVWTSLMQTTFLYTENNSNFMIIMIPIVVLVILGTLSTILTILHLIWRYFHPIGGVRHSSSSSLRILIMNTLSINLSGFMAFQHYRLVQQASAKHLRKECGEIPFPIHVDTQLDMSVLSYMSWVVLPVLISLVNPIVYIAFSNNVLKRAS